MTQAPIRTPAETLVELGERIEARRKARGLSRAELSDRAGINPKSIWALETGRGSTLTTLAAVLKALGLEEALLDMVPVPRVSPMALLGKGRR